MARLPNVDDSQPDPFGPDAAAGASPERYNTRYIIANLKKSERRTRIIVVGVIVLTAAVIVFFLTGRSERPLPKIGDLDTGAAAVTESVPKAPAPAPQH